MMRNDAKIDGYTLNSAASQPIVDMITYFSITEQISHQIMSFTGSLELEMQVWLENLRRFGIRNALLGFGCQVC